MFKGDSPTCPTPIAGRSILFRLHVCFVRAVRAVRVGEAKLCVCEMLVPPYRWGFGFEFVRLLVGSFGLIFVHRCVGFLSF